MFARIDLARVSPRLERLVLRIRDVAEQCAHQRVMRAHRDDVDLRQRRARGRDGDGGRGLGGVAPRRDPLGEQRLGVAQAPLAVRDAAEQILAARQLGVRSRGLGWGHRPLEQPRARRERLFGDQARTREVACVECEFREEVAAGGDPARVAELVPLLCGLLEGMPGAGDVVHVVCRHRALEVQARHLGDAGRRRRRRRSHQQQQVLVDRPASAG